MQSRQDRCVPFSSSFSLFLLTVSPKGLCESVKLLLQIPNKCWPIILLVSSLSLYHKPSLMQPSPSSFHSTDDGHFEQAEYRFASNASDPHCITGVMTFQHGTYSILSNGSLICTPFAEDGRQQVQDPCAAVSNQINTYNATILFLQWRIFPLADGSNHLNLYEFDGTPVAPMKLVASPPNMLPPTTLTTPTASGVAPSKRAIEIEARSDAPRNALLVGSIGALAGLGALLTLLL